MMEPKLGTAKIEVSNSNRKKSMNVIVLFTIHLKVETKYIQGIIVTPQNTIFVILK